MGQGLVPAIQAMFWQAQRPVLMTHHLARQAAGRVHWVTANGDPASQTVTDDGRGFDIPGVWTSTDI